MFRDPLSAVDLASVQYSDVITALQDGQSLAKALHLKGKVGNVFQRFCYRMILWNILILIRWRNYRYGGSYEFDPCAFVHDSIIQILSTLGPAKYCGSNTDSSCQIYANGLTFREKMRVFGMTLYRTKWDRQLIVPIDLIGYEFLSGYVSILERANIRLIPLISDPTLNALSEEDKSRAIPIRDLLADSCLLSIADYIQHETAVVLCYDLDEYSLNPSPETIEQGESLLQAFASIRKIDIDMQLVDDEKRPWYDLHHHYLIGYTSRQV